MTRQFFSSEKHSNSIDDFMGWLGKQNEKNTIDVQRVDLQNLAGWVTNRESGNIAHVSGKFFSIEGIQVRANSTWRQPIIVQPEIGLLGILAKQVNGEMRFLMQAKIEPGNVNGVQLSPTVQATRSNYAQVHGGNEIEYFNYFSPSRRSRVIVDVLQSEHGASFLGKQNRNMIVEIFEEVPEKENFFWLSLQEIKELLQLENLVNMCTRTVVSCIPGDMLAPEGGSASEEDFHTSLRKAFAAPGRPQHTKRNVLSWVTQTRSKVDFHRTHIPLNSVTAEGWDYTGSSISHQSGNYFSVIAVNVEAESREVRSWSQPLISPSGMGLIVLITKRINGTLHALVHARMEAGVLNIAELAPTIQCRPRNYDQLPQELHPRYLDFANAVDPLQVHYNVVHSDEGGRFYHSVSRHMVIEAERDFAQETPADYMWLTFWQLTKFLEHGNYLNIELRSLLACAASMT